MHYRLIILLYTAWPKSIWKLDTPKTVNVFVLYNNQVQFVLKQNISP